MNLSIWGEFQVCISVPLTSNFFVNMTLRMEVAINITLSQSSITTEWFNHVAHKQFSEKVKGAFAV